MCRSELARDGLEDATGYQASSVIVDDHREQARSYRCATCVGASSLAMDLRTPRGVRLQALPLTTIASKLAPTGTLFTSPNAATAAPARQGIRSPRPSAGSA
ncbi:hypothetical protein EJA72_07070 [Pseudomonas sp. PB120]|nr:hypothetical protein [Pseudomonas sp. PB120]